MNKKIFIIIILLIVFSSFTYAIKIDSGLIHYYNFTQGANDTKDAIHGAFDGTITRISSTPDGDDGKGYKTDGLSSSFFVDLNVDNLIQANLFTVCFLYNTTNTGLTLAGWGDDPLILDLRNDGTNLEYYIRDEGSNVRVSPNPYEVTSLFQDLAWHHVCIRLNSSNRLSTIFDGVKVADKITTISSGAWTTESFFGIGVLPYAVRTNWKATEFDELAIYNTALNDSQMLEIATGKNGGYCSPANNPNGCGDVSSTITLFTNLTNNTINYNFEELSFIYNATFTNNDNTFANISFFINDVHNLTLLNINLTHKNIFNITFPNFEGNINISINASHGNVENTLEYYFYKVDNLNIRSQTTHSNNSVQSVLTTFTFQINFTDLNLFHYDISYYNPIGDLIKNITAINLNTNFAENISSILLENIGVYKIDVFAYDSHTKKKISDSWKIKYLINGVEFLDEIRIYDTNIKNTFAWFDTIKEDRYKIKITFYDTKIQHRFYLQTNEELYFIQDSKYKGHFVYFNLRKWIDFEGKNIDNIEVEKINNKLYLITANLINVADEIELESIGDLNELHLTYYVESVNLGVATDNTGIENKLEGISEAVNLGIFIIFFIFLIILFILTQLLHLENKNLYIIIALLFMYLNAKFISLNEITLAWICTICWILLLIDIINIEEGL